LQRLVFMQHSKGVSMLVLRFLATAMALCLVSNGAAHAEESRASDGAAAEQEPVESDSPSAHAELERLEGELQLAIDQERRGRRARAYAGMALGAALVPLGVVLLKREDPVQSALGVGVVVAGSGQLLTGLSMLAPTPVQRLAEEHHRRKQDGASAEALLAETEKRWRTQAKVEHTVRRAVGLAYTTMGAALLPAGATLLLMRGQLFDMGRQTQYKLGAALLGMGAPFVGFGLIQLFEAGPLERSYEASAA
jgi:hypothetical protein